MIDFIRDWLLPVVGILCSIVLRFYPFNCSRKRTYVRDRRLKIGPIEWSSYDREDETKS